jgi:AcrR family transcriptional regulator
MARPASDISPRIVHAARELFLVHGVDGASLRVIAKAAGTSIGMVYYYFETKDALFLAVVEEVYVELLADMRKALAQDVPPQERVLRLYLRLAALSDTELQVVRLILREALVSSARLRSLVKRFETGHLPLIAALIRDGLLSGTFRTDVHPLGLAAATFSLGLIPQLLRRLLGQSRLAMAAQLPSAESAAAGMHQVLMHGIANANAPATPRPPRRRARGPSSPGQPPRPRRARRTPERRRPSE